MRNSCCPEAGRSASATIIEAVKDSALADQAKRRDPERIAELPGSVERARCHPAAVRRHRNQHRGCQRPGREADADSGDRKPRYDGAEPISDAH